MFGARKTVLLAGFAFAASALSPTLSAQSTRPLDDDLRFVADEFVHAAIVRPARVLKDPLARELLPLAAPEHNIFLREWCPRLGCDPAKTERVMLLGTLPDPWFRRPLIAGCVVRASGPIAEKSLAAGFVRAEQDGLAIWSPKRETPLEMFLYLPDERTLVAARSPELLRAMLAAKERKSALVAALRAAGEKHDFALAVSVKPIRDEVVRLYDQRVEARAGQIVPQEEAALAAGMAILKDVDSLHLAIDLDGPKLASLSLQAPGEEAAARLESAAVVALHTLSPALFAFVEALERTQPRAILRESKTLIHDATRATKISRDGLRVSVVISKPDRFRQRADRLAALIQRQRFGENMHNLAIALHNYHDVHNELPPAYVVDKDGKPLYSWRVVLLPYVEQDKAFAQFHLDEAWDSDHNKQFLKRMPAVFRGADDLPEGKTNLLAIVGEDTGLEPSYPLEISDGKPHIRSKTSFGKIIDGLSNTAWLVQVAPERAVPWTSPQEFEFDPEKGPEGLGLPANDWFMVCRMDGSHTAMKKTIDKLPLRMFFGRSDRTGIDLEPYEDP